MISVSVVVPVYRGEDTIGRLATELADTAADWKAQALPLVLSEVIFVNDAAVDDSARVLEELRLRHDWLRVLSLPRNIGQHAATIAGLRESKGNWVATMDEDLQHRPAHLLALLGTAVTADLDLVYAKPTEAVHQSPFRDGSSRLVKTALAVLTANPRIPDFNSFRLMRGEIARAAATAAGPKAYLDVILCACTTRIGTSTIPLKDVRYIEQRSSSYPPLALVAHAWRLLANSLVFAKRKLPVITIDRSKDASLQPHFKARPD